MGYVGDMGPHWSGVEVGEYFDLTFSYDAALYIEASVVVPFQRHPSSGLPTCMMEGIDFRVKATSGDSEYHIRRALVAKVEPLRRGARKKKKTLADGSMRSFFNATPAPPKPALSSESTDDPGLQTPAPRRRHIAL